MHPLPLKYPLKSHRKIIDYPLESIQLAELMGIIFGDGGINNNWQLVITLNSTKDLKYSKYVIGLITKLFNIKVFSRKRPNQDTLLLVVSSTNLVDFLVKKGAVRGNKILQEIDIPDWIKGNSFYEKLFVRGLVDTDGCLYIHKHQINGQKYQNLGFCFTSFSEPLLTSVAAILSKHNIKPHITKNRHCIYLYSHKAVVKYLNVFGCSNPRIFNKYLEFRMERCLSGR